MNKEEIIEECLNRTIKKKICYRCGRIQSHALIYCLCGGTYERKNGRDDLTLLEALTIIKNRDLQSYHTALSPRYFYMIHARLHFDAHGITEKDFLDYLADKYEISEDQF